MPIFWHFKRQHWHLTFMKWTPGVWCMCVTEARVGEVQIFVMPYVNDPKGEKGLFKGHS